MFCKWNLFLQRVFCIFSLCVFFKLSNVLKQWKACREISKCKENEGKETNSLPADLVSFGIIQRMKWGSVDLRVAMSLFNCSYKIGIEIGLFFNDIKYWIIKPPNIKTSELKTHVERQLSAAQQI